MEKEETSKEELKNVNAGAAPDIDYAVACPNCHACMDDSYFYPRKLDSGCDSEKEYTCPVCGHVFRE